MIAIDLSKQQALRDADPKPIQQINFTGNLENSSSVEEVKENVLNFLQGTVKAL